MSRFISLENASEMHREKDSCFGDVVLGGEQCLFASSDVERGVSLAFSFSSLAFHFHCKHVNFLNCPMLFRFIFRHHGRKGQFSKIKQVASSHPYKSDSKGRRSLLA